MKKQKRIVPNVVRGGVAIPLGANYFLMKGKTHEQGGIDIGKDLEVENGELIKLDKNNMTIVSNAPIINGISPAEYALGGLKDGTFVDRFKEGFKYQEKYKDINGLKDDGTKAKIGKEKTIDEMNSKMLFIPENEKEINIQIPLEIGQKPLNLKKYIGGTPNEARLKAFNKIPGIKEKIQEISNTYGISPNVLTHRFLKEGFLDQKIKEYNSLPSLYQRDYWERVPHMAVNGFDSLGLDDAGRHILDNKYNLRRDIVWNKFFADNEKGRRVMSVETDNLWDGLEIKAADMEYRQNELRKRGISEKDLPTYVNAAYNLGLYHDDLKNADFIRKNYTVPNYYKLGGKTQMKQIKRNVPSTGKRTQAELGLFDRKIDYLDLLIPGGADKAIENIKSKLPTQVTQINVPEIALKTKKIETSNKTKGNFKQWFGDNIDTIGDFTNGLVGIGSAIASHRINNKMLNNLEELPEITDSIPLNKTKLKTSYNIHPQLAKARRIANRLNRYVDRNTSSSQTAINRRRQNELDYLENFNTLYGQKENVENQLINQDRMLQHQTDQYNTQLANQDIVRRDTRKAENVQLRNAIAEKKAENSVALADNISSIINNMIMNRKQGRSHNKTLKVMAAGFPNISSDYLKELGLI